jgi:hypothetical protein
LQSDILPKPIARKDFSEKEKASKTFRYRVEEDEAYSTRKRNADLGGPAKPGRPRGSRRFEELTLESDEEYGDEDDNEYTGRSSGRASNWLARRNEGEEDLPTELPPDFRDGNVRPNREKDRERHREYAERRRTMPPKPKAGIRPVGRPPKHPKRNSTGNISDEDGIHEDDDQSSEALLLAQQAAAAALEAQKKEEETRAEKVRIEAAEREAQENLRAKMALFEGSDDENNLIDGFLGDLPDEEEPEEQEQPWDEASPEPVRTGPPQPTNSILTRLGMEGKKVKIVGATASRRNGDNTRTTTITTITAPASTFTTANKKSLAIDLSDSDSEEDIPASAPMAKKPLGRPPGRPSMVPTRGSSLGKRGRGRPRKTM